MPRQMKRERICSTPKATTDVGHGADLRRSAVDVARKEINEQRSLYAPRAG
jgi:hypothetical protein